MRDTRRVRPPPLPTAGLPILRRRVRLLALVAVRDERAHIPALLRNLAPHVDGIVALDDASTDGSAELLEAHPAVVEVLRVPPRPAWDEPANHRALVAAGLRHGADWLLAIDADERVERSFRARAERAIARGRLLGIKAFRVRLLELWDSTATYRADAIWATKGPARLWRASDDHEFDSRALHGVKAPLQARWRGRFPQADLIVYHLGMLHREDRAARLRRYRELDPDERWQPGVGYAYLTDERGLELRPVPRARRFAD